VRTARHPLDNAVWSALSGPHAVHADGHGLARRYDPEVSVFAAVVDDTAEAWDDLAALTAPGQVAVLFRPPPIPLPDGWTRELSGDGLQMVLDGELARVPTPESDVDGPSVSIRPLGDDDVPAMTELVRITDPGPFRRRTIDLGGYVGIFHGDELVAMAGQRLRPTGYCEVSAVCTHPDARRRGYAAFVSARVAHEVLARGEVPFLHLAASNDAARAVYEGLGFRLRRPVSFVVVRPPADDEQNVTP
jgi:ribosomal protein S18 acetylase RimI-like enzyme